MWLTDQQRISYCTEVGRLVSQVDGTEIICSTFDLPQEVSITPILLRLWHGHCHNLIWGKKKKITIK